MSASFFKTVTRVTALGSVTLLASLARAAPPAKEVCVEAYSKGQDARDANQLILAAKLFLTCAQPGCPTLVQGDCARLAEEMDHLQPSMTFAARDSGQNDLIDTTVSVDGTVVASRLGDGKAYPIDPGRHDVRFIHAGKEVVVTVVMSAGERGRNVVGLFVSPGSPSSGAPAMSSPPPAAPEPKRPALPLVAVAAGAVTALAGGILLGAGVSQVPSTCSLAARTCAAPPGDPVFATAASAISMVNLGGIVAGAGVLVLGGGLAWYWAQPLRLATPPANATGVLLPWFGPREVGISFSGSL